jgi:diguanylate cyclase (GGDEF)-like protein
MSPRLRLPVSPALALSALAGTSAAAALVLAGARLGPLALLLALPAGALAGYAWRRVGARQDGLQLLARVDARTGLPNRRLLNDRLAHEVARHHRHRRRLVVLSVGLEGFDGVQDRYGRAAGDEILREIARGLQRAVRDEDTVARTAGATFAVLAPEAGWREAEVVAERLRWFAGRSVDVEGVGVTIGAAVFPEDGATPELLLARADTVRAAVPRRRDEEDRPALRAA